MDVVTPIVYHLHVCNNACAVCTAASDYWFATSRCAATTQPSLNNASYVLYPFLGATAEGIEALWNSFVRIQGKRLSAALELHRN